MKEIKLPCGRLVKVDDELFEFLNQFKWWSYGRGGKIKRYVVKGSYGLPTFMQMTDVIMGKPLKGFVVDHINGDTHDNTLANLRVVTRAQNIRNSVKHCDNRSGYKGVTWSSSHRSWQVQIYAAGVKKSIGHFRDLIDAAVSYNRAAKEMHGEFGKPNLIPIEAYET